MGHAYVYWGGVRADVCPVGRLLTFPGDEAQIRWLGICGLPWSQLLPELQYYIRLDRAPDVLVLHAGAPIVPGIDEGYKAGFVMTVVVILWSLVRHGGS